MTVQHSAITDPNIHEPKGVSTAVSNSVYVASGGGSGSWLPLSYTILVSIEDISTAGTVYVPVPFSGKVVRSLVTLQGGISGTNAVVGVANNVGSPMESTTVTTAGSAAGSTFSTTITTNNTMLQGQTIRVSTDGASTGSEEALVMLVLERL
jgi:hypothetical protein